MDQPVILCGLGQVGRRVLDYLHAAGIPVVVVDDRCTLAQLKLDNVRVVHGDFREREVLLDAGLKNARGVLILTSDDLVNISATLLVRHLDPNVRVVVRLFNQNLIPRLGKAVTNVYALSVSYLTAPMLALTALTGQALGTFHVDQGRRLVAEVALPPNSSFLGQSVRAVATQHRAQILAHFRTDSSERFLGDVDDSAPLASGDRLVICGDPRDLGPLLEDTAGEILPHLRWAGWLRRHGRALWQTLSDIDPLVRLWTFVLIFVVIASTAVFYIGIGKSLPYSLLRAVSVISTGDDLHPEELPSGWAMVFVSVLRVAGAAVMAAFTAFLTNYLLRARLRGALEVRRIPDGGHVIVCGLGNIGFRVVEELIRYGERIVVIESQRDGRFMAAARRINVVTIVGDATVLEVLRQANAGAARAVIAATNNELANIEIALLARDLNPKQRVVVRLNDPQLSNMLRETANIALALSLPSLAAPAFVAALFGDRVLTVFLARQRLMAAVEFHVEPDDTPFIGQTVRALAIDYHLLPVSLRDATGNVRPQISNHRCAPGDRLTCIMSLVDLGRMLRRDQVPSGWSVEITNLPVPARPLMIQLLRERGNIDSKTAEAALTRFPVTAASGLTRGQAEELRFVLNREGIESKLAPPNTDAGHNTDSDPLHR